LLPPRQLDRFPIAPVVPGSTCVIPAPCITVISPSIAGVPSAGIVSSYTGIVSATRVTVISPSIAGVSSAGIIPTRIRIERINSGPVRAGLRIRTGAEQKTA
jgi:hypothetical protein